MSETQIFNSRILNYPVEMVYQAFANPEQLKRWWGPEGFANTIHEFELKPGGNWILTMHGPEKGNYENSSVFEKIEANQFVSWKRKSQPLFNMEIAFKKIEENKSEISFRMIFDTAEECNKIIRFAEPSNEENFDRLERELSRVTEINH